MVGNNRIDIRNISREKLNPGWFVGSITTRRIRLVTDVNVVVRKISLGVNEVYISNDLTLRRRSTMFDFVLNISV